MSATIDSTTFVCDGCGLEWSATGIELPEGWHCESHIVDLPKAPKAPKAPVVTITMDVELVTISPRARHLCGDCHKFSRETVDYVLRGRRRERERALAQEAEASDEEATSD